MIDSLQKSSLVPGLDIAVAIDGKTIWSEAFGFADLELKTPVVSGKTRFRIGSVSKPLTTTALAVLMDSNRINIDLPVDHYVGYLPEKQYKFTTRQLSGHIAGIRNYKGNEFFNTRHFNTVKDGLSMFIEDSLIYEPGTQYKYTSHGFNLLSAVIEGASEQTFLRFIHNTVFDPIGMESTCADLNDSIIINRTSFYKINGNGTIENAPYVDNSYKWAGGGFISTTSDLILFGQAMMKPGIVSEKTLTEITTSQVLDSGAETHYGIGWQIWKQDGRKVYGHGGGSVGGITVFKIYPEDELVIVILSNLSDLKFGNIPDRITNAFLTAKNE
ncbi:MAG: serine hydrolase domain-containing protein [Cyclobacteriaceae bacterium]